MACIHRFVDDLMLEAIDFQPTTLIVGTFNPGWTNLGNYAPWFYGRTRNNYFWEVLPRLYGEMSLRQASPADWRAFCRKQHIALTDLIACINDANANNPDHIGYLINYRDDLIAKHFKSFDTVNLPALLAKQPTITQVYLTRRLNHGFWQKLWQPTQHYCQEHGIKHQTLITPSASARFQLPKSQYISLGDFILAEWQANWHSV